MNGGIALVCLVKPLVIKVYISKVDAGFFYDVKAHGCFATAPDSYYDLCKVAV